MAKGLLLFISSFIGILSFCLITHAETTFTNVSLEAGINDNGHGYSVVFADYDNDGNLDIYLSHWGDSPQPNKLYKNNGNGTFTDVAEKAGVACRSKTASSIFGDYDNDGDLDLYLINGWRNTLYKNNGDGTFSDVTDEAGVGDQRDGKVGIFWDYNNDGHLDIYATTWGQGVKLYKNNSDGTFSDVSGKVGDVLSRGGHSAAVGDYDNDGDLDLFAPVPYRNNGNGTFTNVTKEAGMEWIDVVGGVTLGDYNNDGNLDVYIVIDGKGILYKNNGDGTFSDVTKKAGVGLPGIGRSSDCCHSAVFVDYDNDGYLDLYDVDEYLYRNNGDGTFTNVIKEAGIESGVANVQFRWGASFGDYDNDGDLDLYLPRVGNWNAAEGPSDELFRNNGNDNHWLHIKTVGTQSNKYGIGARVTVKAGKLSQIRDIVNEWSRSCPPVQFGLGEHLLVDLVEIKWPSGQVTVLTSIPADRMIEVTEGSEGYRTLHRGRHLAIEPSGKCLGTWGAVRANKLYQNYPNPFNPETWIPYQLGEDTRVEIRIYTSDGQLVRTLNLGRKQAGSYTSKEKAVYWDGNNEAGECVSSGIYFYTIQAGNYSYTKKMVITE